MTSIRFLFPAIAFALSFLLSGYLFVAWLRCCTQRPRFLLYWSLALLLIYLFQIPVILTSLGRVITVTRFNLFFSLTFPITLLALVFLYWGVLEVIGIRLKPKMRWGFFVWVSAAVLFFGYYFISRNGVIETHALPLVGNIIFYLPLRTLIILTLIRWLSRTPKTIYGILGAAGIIGESVLGIIRNLLVIKSVLTYPPEFWYVALSSLEIFFVLQTIGLFLLVLGFSSFYQLKRSDEKSFAVAA